MTPLEEYARQQMPPSLFGALVRALKRRLAEHSPDERRILIGSGTLSLLTLPILLIVGYPEIDVSVPPSYQAKVTSPPPAPEPLRAPPPPPIDYTQPVREIPKKFPLHTRMPGRTEISYSLPISAVDFDPERDLVVIDDERVWWESDNDDHTGDTEDDHLFHKAMETPFRRLVELAVAEGITLKVQDVYRAEGVHHAKSLHKQGRAIDVTAFDVPLSRIGALAWAAGFDWVYFEAKGGAHIHASVKP